MKKIIISVFALLTLTSSNMVDDWAIIYCKPDLNKCISNLKHQLLWLDIDYETGAINQKAYESYKLVAENTLLSIEMILDPAGCHCDTTGKKDRYKLPK